MVFEIWKSSSSLGDLRGGPLAPPPPAGRVTIQTPAGRGLKKSAFHLSEREKTKDSNEWFEEAIRTR